MYENGKHTCILYRNVWVHTCTEIPDGNVWGHIYTELWNDDPVCPSTAPEDVT